MLVLPLLKLLLKATRILYKRRTWTDGEKRSSIKKRNVQTVVTLDIPPARWLERRTYMKLEGQFQVHIT